MAQSPQTTTSGQKRKGELKWNQTCNNIGLYQFTSPALLALGQTRPQNSYQETELTCVAEAQTAFWL